MADPLGARIEAEIALLVARHPGHEFKPEGNWVRLPPISLVEGWNRPSTPVVFQFPASGYPQNPFYGFYVPSGLRFRDETPTNFTDPASAQPPWGDHIWAFFSGNPEPWLPQQEAAGGSNILSWILCITERFRSGK